MLDETKAVAGSSQMPSVVPEIYGQVTYQNGGEMESKQAGETERLEMKMLLKGT